MVEKQWSWTLEEWIPNQHEDVVRIQQAVIAQLESEGWENKVIFGVRLSMEEAMVNAIRHGNQSHSHKRVHIVCKLNKDRIFVQITDEGEGFVPEDIPDPTLEENLDSPNGRGLMLMRNFMTRVEYNTAGNRVIMEKLRQDKPNDL